MVREGYLKQLDCESSVLYLFLLTVADRDGLSWYSDRRICELTPLPEVTSCRDVLIAADLIAFKGGVYQILSLPAKPLVKIDQVLQEQTVKSKSVQELETVQQINCKDEGEDKDSFPPELYALLRKLS